MFILVSGSSVQEFDSHHLAKIAYEGAEDGTYLASVLEHKKAPEVVAPEPEPQAPALPPAPESEPAQ